MFTQQCFSCVFCLCFDACFIDKGDKFFSHKSMTPWKNSIHTMLLSS